MAIYGRFEIKVKGASKAVKAISEAIKRFDEDCDIRQTKNCITVDDIYKVFDEDDVQELATVVARAASGASFTMEGFIECTVSSEMMHFSIACENGKLAVRSSDWCYEYCSDALEEYDTYKEYCEDRDDIESEEDFEKVKNNELTYFIGGKIFLEIPLREATYIEY